jgi:hypothetical protein
MTTATSSPRTSRSLPVYLLPAPGPCGSVDDSDTYCSLDNGHDGLCVFVRADAGEGGGDGADDDSKDGSWRTPMLVYPTAPPPSPSDDASRGGAGSAGTETSRDDQRGTTLSTPPTSASGDASAAPAGVSGASDIRTLSVPVLPTDTAFEARADAAMRERSEDLVAAIADVIRRQKKSDHSNRAIARAVLAHVDRAHAAEVDKATEWWKTACEELQLRLRAAEMAADVRGEALIEWKRDLEWTDDRWQEAEANLHLAMTVGLAECERLRAERDEANARAQTAQAGTAWGWQPCDQTIACPCCGRAWWPDEPDEDTGEMDDDWHDDGCEFYALWCAVGKGTGIKKDKGSQAYDKHGRAITATLDRVRAEIGSLVASRDEAVRRAEPAEVEARRLYEQRGFWVAEGAEAGILRAQLDAAMTHGLAECERQREWAEWLCKGAMAEGLRQCDEMRSMMAAAEVKWNDLQWNRSDLRSDNARLRRRVNRLLRRLVAARDERQHERETAIVDAAVKAERERIVAMVRERAASERKAARDSGDRRDWDTCNYCDVAADTLDDLAREIEAGGGGAK